MMLPRNRSVQADALTDALKRSGGDLLAYLQRRVAIQEDAADLLAETMTTAWRRVPHLPDGEEAARMWLFVIARNSLANFGRTSMRQRHLADRLKLEISVLHRPTPLDTQENQAIRDAVENLTPPLKELVELVHWEGFTITEAAQVLDVPASTARTRYQTARQLLKEALSDPIDA